MNIRLKKIVFTSILTALSLIAFMLESLFPPLFIPGARMGLSNIFILITLLFVGRSYSFLALTVKAVLGSLFSGNVSAILYALPAGLIALTAEVIILNFDKRFSVLAASVMGSVLNMTVQNVAFCLITGATAYLIYLPYLSLIGAGAGLIVGFAVFLIKRYLPNKYNLTLLYSEEKN